MQPLGGQPIPARGGATLEGVRSISPRLQLTLLIAGALLLLGLFPRLIERIRAHERELLPPAAGLFLVARPGSVDGNFDKTVVLLVEVGPERIWGLVLNRPRTPKDEPLPAGVDRWGGPVGPEQRITLVRAREAQEQGRWLLDGLTWREGPRPQDLPKGAALTFSGAAVWGPGQLERELERGGWMLVRADAERVFREPGSLWAECLEP
jgi:putative transcriptional regulator